ncbi:uncharacterized protein XM38_011820 [Halomicronema hongdechloris C2206]|uniref:FIST C-domain domain-containing protein n=1 Tax=Halomicronema hongdechloris C2206 TaxID=1641165 RepID=A0A1Z3HJ08_9CYAN|nr:FIST N-terminal domain-containing protein [Halomicronema hongdechloris]ASC70246.1 uncharacterized protein XM38_011820 [Halomicronema hongdechloris C2206]
MDATTQPMEWANAISTQVSLEAAVQDVTAQLRHQLSEPPDLGLVFISSAFASEYSRLLPLLQAAIDIPVLIGCSGGGVVGMTAAEQAVEIEAQPALSLSLARLPQVSVQGFHLTQDDLPDLDSPPDAWHKLIGIPPSDHPNFILLADPFSSGISELLQGLDFAYPGSVKVGGLASVGSINRSSSLFCNQEVHHDGIVGVALSGQIVMDTIVAQGCRPIGHPYRIVEAERNILIKLAEPDGDDCEPQSPLEALQGIFQDFSEDERKLAQDSLFVGIAQDSFKQTLEHGDFLIRQLIGVDPRVGAIAVGDRIRPGQRIQFHLRDARTSAEDLDTLLQRYRQQSDLNQAAPVGALMFTCMGRGQGLYEQPHFDASLFQQYFEDIPLSGFFCGGEIGPIGSTTFLHGYTSVFGICRQPSSDDN